MYEHIWNLFIVYEVGLLNNLSLNLRSLQNGPQKPFLHPVKHDPLTLWQSF